MKNPDEVLPPSRDPVLVGLGKDESDRHVPFSLLDDLLLHLRYGSAIESSAGRPVGVCIVGVAHTVRSPIASRTD